MAAKPSEDPGGVRGQIEMLRDNALGNFRDILVNIAKDTAMLIWLDGRTNTRARPQENFGREIMELFTMGVGHYTEADVYAAARVFTGWNLHGPVRRPTAPASTTFVFNAEPARHGREDVQLSDLPGRQQDDSCAGGRRRACRTASTSSTRSPRIPRRPRYLATKLYRFFVSEFGDVDEAFVDRIAATYLQSRYDMSSGHAGGAAVAASSGIERNHFTRYSWPVEFVVRAMKDIGWTRLLAERRADAAREHGTDPVDPPDVAGWDLGQSWFSTGSMLARMNFASALAGNQKFKLATRGQPTTRRRPDELLVVRARLAQDAAAFDRARDDGSAQLPGGDRPLDRQRRRRCRTKSPAWCTSWREPPEYQFV